MRQPQNLNEHQISKETQITNEPQYSKQNLQFANDPEIFKQCRNLQRNPKL